MMRLRCGLLTAAAAMLAVAPALALDAIVTPKTFTFGEPPNELILESGRKLGPITVVYETYGTLDPDGRNAILVLHGLGGTAHAAGRHKPGERPGWWAGAIGPGKPFDTEKYFVISPQALAGGHGDNKLGSGTTGPQSIDPRTGKRYGMRFPVFTVRDMVHVHMKLLEHLGVKHLLVVSGISMGGYQSLEFITTYPDFVDGTIPLVSRGRSPSQHMMRHFVQRQSIMNDPNWQNGDYYGTGKYPTKGMATASVLSSVAYNNSPYWYENNMEESDAKNSAYAGFENKFKIEKELWERSLAGAEEGLDANCWLYRSWAVTRQNIGWKRGDYSRGWAANLADALRLVQADVLMMPSRTDDSMRPEWAKEIVDILRSMGKKAKLHIIDTERGHGGATEYYQTNPVMAEFINQLPGAKRTDRTSSR
jgi:homoserine O-acetyltransferase/O-succinyltransferase